MKDEALKLALEALRSAAAELYKASSYCNKYEVLGNTNDAITAIQQALAAQPTVPLTEMAQILCDRLAKEQAVYLSMETAKSLVRSMLTAAPEKGQP